MDNLSLKYCSLFGGKSKSEGVQFGVLTSRFPNKFYNSNMLKYIIFK